MRVEWLPRMDRYRGRHRRSAQRPAEPEPAGNGSPPADEGTEPELVRPDVNEVPS
jgi:hypothetical protein